MMEKIEKINYFNVLKGIAIFLVVVGHATSGMIHEYTYSYHLALFFFITGFLYNEKKYGENPALNIGNKIKNNWGKFMMYTTLLGLLHFTGKFLGIYNLAGEKWNLYTFRNYILNNIVMNNTEALCGAMWFVAPLIVASGLLGLIVYWGIKAEKNTGIHSLKHIVIISITFICLLLGNERMVTKFQLNFRVDVALFVLPLLVAGYYINTYVRDFNKYLKWYVAVPCLILTFYLCNKEIQNVLAGQFVELWSFYLFSVIGIYQSMYFAKIICKFTKVIKVLFAFIGCYTFEIMAFHFLVFKMIDVICFVLHLDTDVSKLSAFPHTYNLSVIYIICGCFAPAICKYGYDFEKSKIIYLLKK